MDILGFPCDRLIANINNIDQSVQVEYFLSQHHKFDKGIGLPNHRTDIEYPHLAIPLATVKARGGSAGALQVSEAIDIRPTDTLSKEFFTLPSSSKLVLNGLVLDSPVQPKRGYHWWYNKMQSSIRYPKNARRKGLEGSVVVMFTVTGEGSIEDTEVVNEADPSLAKQVQQFLSKPSVQWEPGRLNGKPVASTLILPINFKLTP